MRYARRLLVILALLLSAASATPPAASAQPGGVPAVWFGPAPDSPDLLDLFTRPQAWAKTRPKIGAFLFSPDAVERPHRGSRIP